MDKSTVIAIDLAKTKFEIAVSDEPGRVNRHRRLDRSEFLVFFAQTPAATVVMEACGARMWTRPITSRSGPGRCTSPLAARLAPAKPATYASPTSAFK